MNAPRIGLEAVKEVVDFIERGSGCELAPFAAAPALVADPEQPLTMGKVRDLWVRFLRTGSSRHSARCRTLPYLLMLCEARQLSYDLMRTREGAVVTLWKD